MSVQVAADLRAAAEVLRRDGWARGLFHRRIAGGWRHCAVGATEAATGWWQDGTYAEGGDGPARSGRMWAALGRHLGLGSSPVGVYAWNDAPARTAGEVIAAFEAAADAAEKEDQ